MKTPARPAPPARLLAAAFLLAAPLAAAEPAAAAAPAPAGGAAGHDRAGAACVEVVGKPGARVNIFSSDATLASSRYYYSDRGFGRREKFPDGLEGLLFYELPFKEEHTYRCTRAGKVTAIVSVSQKRDHTAKILALGFAPSPGAPAPFQLFGGNPVDRFAVFEKNLRDGETLTLPPAALLAGFEPPRDRPAGAGELLHNGIRLPGRWPPPIDWRTDEPPGVPWLENRPAVVPIDIGRQLFVDDFLIETTDLERHYHHPEKFPGNPVLKPETQIEKEGRGGLAVAAPKSGGLWWNPEKQLFELWYEAGWVATVAYADSRDGIHWRRPGLPLRPGTNQVLPSEILPDSWTVVPDPDATDPKKKFKIFLRGGGTRGRARYFTSPDGLDWGPAGEGGITGDRSTMFYNPFRKKWIFSLRWNSPGGRSRAYWEASDFERGMKWLPDEPAPWARADRLDPPDPRVGDRPQLYNLDAVAYESLMLGFFEILHGPENDVNARKGIPKFTGLNFAYSRDGFHWHRPDRAMAINSEYEAGKWDRGYVQSLGNICVIRGDRLWFYYIGFAGDENVRLGENGVASSMKSGLYANGATGVATLRRDGFASLDAGADGGTLLTRPVTFSGSQLFVNAAAPRGSLLAEICDEAGAPIPPFTLANCIPFTGDSTLAGLRWQNAAGLSALAGKPVRIRFHLPAAARLYSFWVSRDATGRSDGYVAGGGPGYTGATDTVGRAALEAEARHSRKP
ncbi:MAG: hypothetical protein LBC18_11990 [Opitutaceae bacterium]|jgi:hypothetical protein|nr:hypothetical protein [Opitutaceae bacterium]